MIDKKESGLRTFPVVRVICPACGKTESETWTVAVGSEGTTLVDVFQMHRLWSHETGDGIIYE